VPTLPAASSGAATSAVAATANLETTVIASGTPTDVYAELARRALHCWFGADGPLKATHIFYAEAAPPEQGGAADIMLHEKEDGPSDRRGVRAFHIAIAREGGGVRVAITNLRMQEPIARLMVQDAQTWARGEEGCATRTLFPARPAAPGKTATGR
jgi:hypothetical protein